MWSNNRCTHCEWVEVGLVESAFTTWQSGSGCYFWFGCGNAAGELEEDGDNGAGYKWATVAGSDFPFIRIYWNGGAIDKKYSGVKGQSNAPRNCFPLDKTKRGQSIAEELEKQLKPYYDSLVTVYTVTFNANGGTVSEATRNVNENAAVGTLPTPTYSGHTFEGWFTAVSGGTQATAATVITANVTYYAHWSENAPPPPVTPTRKNTMFGLWKDCTIITKDNKALKFTASTRQITLLGDYNPLGGLPVVTNFPA